MSTGSTFATAPNASRPGTPGVSGPQTNGLGLAGFIVSVVGIVASCGLISPIGLVMSLFGLRREPRGFAIAGVVLGVVGSIWLFVALALGLFATILAAVGLAAAVTEVGAMEQSRLTKEAMEKTREAIVAYEAEAGKPVYALQLLEPRYISSAEVTDAWGHPIILELTLENEYTLRSTGPDGQPETTDDVVVRFPSGAGSTPGARPTLEVIPPRQPL